MDMWMASLKPRETEVQAFERAVVELGRSEMEKNAGDFSEAMDGLLETPKTAPRVNRLVEQTKVARQMGQELAHQQALAKEAGIAGSIMGAIKPMAGKALGWAAQNPGKAMGVGGAALGAIGGAAAAQPGSRMKGALGGAALGGAAGYGASKIPGLGQKAMDYTSGAANMGLNRMGMQMKFASAKMAGMLSTGLGRAGAGALVGGAMGALHSSDAAKQGLAPAHHLRNALMGAAGGAALGGAVHGAVPAGAAGRAETALAKTHMPTGGTTAAIAHAPAGRGGLGFSPEIEARQMERTRRMANSPIADQARGARGRDAMMQNAVANPTLAGLKGPTAAAAARGTMPGKGVINSTGPTVAAMPKMAGREFLKRAFSMSAQAEPGTPGGAQEPEETDQQIIAPAPPPMRESKPAMELFGALKHLSPKLMRGLQVAQPGS